MLRGLEAVVALDRLGVSIGLQDIYAGLEFRPKPKLVELPADELDSGSGPE